MEELEHDENIKFLSNAMEGFRDAKIKGIRAFQWEHGQFGPLQKINFIPQIFCPPDQYFKEVKVSPDTVYYKRCCPLFDYTTR